jgi:hypothetical protein
MTKSLVQLASTQTRDEAATSKRIADALRNTLRALYDELGFKVQDDGELEPSNPLSRETMVGEDFVRFEAYTKRLFANMRLMASEYDGKTIEQVTSGLGSNKKDESEVNSACEKIINAILTSSNGALASEVYDTATGRPQMSESQVTEGQIYTFIAQRFNFQLAKIKSVLFTAASLLAFKYQYLEDSERRSKQALMQHIEPFFQRCRELLQENGYAMDKDFSTQQAVDEGARIWSTINNNYSYIRDIQSALLGGQNDPAVALMCQALQTNLRAVASSTTTEPNGTMELVFTFIEAFIPVVNTYLEALKNFEASWALRALLTSKEVQGDS